MNIELKDSVCAVNDALTQQMAPLSNWWMWAAVVELAVIMLLLLIVIKQKKANKTSLSTKRQKVKETLAEEVDFTNVINSSFHASALYEQLIKKCHPDRFPNDEQKRQTAEYLSAEIGKNKHNLKKLNELKQRAVQELNINL
mgnify:CR=1 FL=1